MDAWELLRDSSTLVGDGYDAWEHLNNLGSGGGGGPCEGLTLLDGMEIEMEDRCVDVELELSGVDVIIEDELEVEVEILEFEVEIC